MRASRGARIWWWCWRLVLVVLLLAGCSSSRVTIAVTQALAPLHAAMLELLMPGFRAEAVQVRHVGAQVKVTCSMKNSTYFVAQGHAVRPGFDFSAETPARLALLSSTVVVVGLLFFLVGSGRRLAAGLLLAAGGIGLLQLVGPPVVLAGSIWNLISPEQASEVSLEGTLIWASQSLLHGGGYGVAVLSVVLAVWATRGGQPSKRAIA